MNHDLDSAWREFDQQLTELLNNHLTIKSPEKTRQAVREFISKHTGTIFQKGRNGFEEMWQHWDPDPRYQVGLYVHDSIAVLPEETAEAAVDVLVRLANVSVTPTRKRLFKDAFADFRNAAADYLELRGHEVPTEDADDKSKTVGPSKAKLSVDVERLTVTWKRRTLDLGSELAARWLKVLAENEGKWITAPNLCNYDAELDGVRTDRQKKHIPKPILRFIKSSKRYGSRLVLPQK